MGDLSARLRIRDALPRARSILDRRDEITPALRDDMIARLCAGTLVLERGQARVWESAQEMARNGLIDLRAAQTACGIALRPIRSSFTIEPLQVTSGVLRMARFAYVNAEDGAWAIRNSAADCSISLEDSAGLAFLAKFHAPADVGQMQLTKTEAVYCAFFVKAQVLQSCDAEGRSADDLLPERRQWNFHDALFHAQSRLGTTEKVIGAAWPFRGEIEQAPVVKDHPWTGTVIELPRVDIHRLALRDMTLTMALETRRSARDHSLIPLSSRELGEFLFRAVRLRGIQTTADGDYASRPYPGGGGIYESEFYITINQCADIPRGFYYFDPRRHALCLVSPPDDNLTQMIHEANAATAGQCWPQILITIASRHTRFGWKYNGMSYAAQLKNVGVIYQTMYLVATAMGIGGCALGLGNTDRFGAMTGLDWFEEGSVGEFVIGRVR